MAIAELYGNIEICEMVKTGLENLRSQISGKKTAPAPPKSKVSLTDRMISPSRTISTCIRIHILNRIILRVISVTLYNTLYYKTQFVSFILLFSMLYVLFIMYFYFLSETCSTNANKEKPDRCKPDRCKPEHDRLPHYSAFCNRKSLYLLI